MVWAFSAAPVHLQSCATNRSAEEPPRWPKKGTWLLIRTRNASETTILDLAGPLMVGESELEFRQKIKELLDEGVRRFAINLAGVPEMDSWGLGALVRHCTQVRKAGGRCIFFAPVAHVLQLLKTANLDSVLDIVETEADALSC